MAAPHQSDTPLGRNFKAADYFRPASVANFCSSRPPTDDLPFELGRGRLAALSR